MFEREAESARLDRTLTALAEGEAGLIVISGEAGIGKTRLIDEALDRTDGRLRVLRADCLALGSSIPYLPFAEVIRDLAHQVPAHRLAHLLGPARTELARFLPELATAEPDGEAPEPALTPAARGNELERLRLYEAFLRLTERIAADQPTVVVIEDLQWIDLASLELLAFLAHGVRKNDQATLIVSVRPEEIEDKDRILTLLAELGRTSGAERIELGPLSTEATGRIAAAILDEPPSSELVAHVRGLSDGNPLFAEELLATWRRRGPDAPLPPKLRDLLAARLAQVPDEVLEVLRIAAAAGRSVDDRLLTRASGLDEQHVRRAVRAAVDDYILIRGEAADGPGYRFRHEILRSVVAAQVLPDQARAIHAAYAAALAEEAPARRSAAELAGHWDAAGDRERALAAHVDAGHAAVAALAFEQARTHFTRALELWELVDDPASHAAVSREELMGSAASAAARAGAFEQAVTLMQELIARPDQLDAEAWQLARSSLRWYHWESGQLEAALAEAEAAVADPTIPERWRANALSHAAGLLLYLQRTEDAAERALEARAAAEAASAEEERILAEGVLGWCRVLEGEVERGLDGLRRVVEGAQAVEGGRLKGRYPVGSVLAHAQLATALELAGHLDEAYAVAVDGAVIAVEQGVARTFGSMLEANAARALWQLGRWPEARELSERALAAGAVGAGRISLLAGLAALDVASGRKAEADAAIGAAEGLIDDHAPIDVRRWLTAAAAERALWAGDASDALARLALAAADSEEPAVATPAARPAMLDSSVPYLLALGARACADASRAERAAGEEAGLSALARSQVEDWIARAEARGSLADVWAADIALAKAELTRGGDREGRLDRWQEAHERLADRPYQQAYAGWRLAESLIASRDRRDEARSVLLSAVRAAEALGATMLADECHGLARRARLDISDAEVAQADGRGDGERPYGLTEREAEVLALLAAGLANQEIAEHLFISPKTASVHVSNIYGKLGVDSRVAAATLAHEMGLDRLPEDAS